MTGNQGAHGIGAKRWTIPPTDILCPGAARSEAAAIGAQTVMLEQAIGLVDNDTLLRLDSLGPDHKAIKPNLQTGQTSFGEFTRLGSQIEMTKTPEFWADPIIHPIGSSRPVWLPR